MKKVLSLVLALTLVLGSFGFAFAAPASDVKGTDYEDAVIRLTALNVLTGYPDGTFKPDNTITRAEFAAAVMRELGLEASAQVSKGTTAFTDVPAEHWASGYVNLASKLGYINGMGDGTFAPSSRQSLGGWSHRYGCQQILRRPAVGPPASRPTQCKPVYSRGAGRGSSPAQPFCSFAPALRSRCWSHRKAETRTAPQTSPDISPTDARRSRLCAVTTHPVRGTTVCH